MHPEDGRVVSSFSLCRLSLASLLQYMGTAPKLVLSATWTTSSRASSASWARPEFIGPVNLGNPVEFTIRQLAEQVLALAGGGSKLIDQTLPEDDPKQRQPDITLAQSELGWELVVPLSDGLPKTIEYFKALSSSGR